MWQRIHNIDSPGGSDSKESVCNARDTDSSPGSGRSPGEGNGYLLQYSRLENSRDSGAGQALVRVAAKSRTQLSDQWKDSCIMKGSMKPILLNFIWRFSVFSNAITFTQENSVMDANKLEHLYSEWIYIHLKWIYIHFVLVIVFKLCKSWKHVLFNQLVVELRPSSTTSRSYLS